MGATAVPLRPSETGAGVCPSALCDGDASTDVRTGALTRELAVDRPHILFQSDISRRQRAWRGPAERLQHWPGDALRRLSENLELQAKSIAQALHDEAGQLLTSAHIALADAARDLPPAARERLQEVKKHLESVEDQLRRIAHELHPRILDDIGLVPALRFLAEGIEKRRGISIVVDATLARRLPSLIETTLYRFAQEALTNVSKHAKATHVTIRLEHDATTLRCSIEDNGVGFDSEAVLARLGEQGFGLNGIRERLEALGGTVKFNSFPGRGTQLSITMPLEL